MKNYVLIGDSGHAKVIEDCIVANGYRVIAKLDDKYTTSFQDGPYLKGPLCVIKDLLNNNNIKVIISIGNNEVRNNIFERLQLPIDLYGLVKHPTAVISPSVKIGEGTVIMPNVVINADSIIGNHAILNTGSIIEHDCKIDDYVHISPGAVLTGGVEVGIGTQIGAKASIIPCVKVGNWSIIGAGSVVIKNISSNVTAIGVPTNVIKERRN